MSLLNHPQNSQPNWTRTLVVTSNLHCATPDIQRQRETCEVPINRAGIDVQELTQTTSQGSGHDEQQKWLSTLGEQRGSVVSANDATVQQHQPCLPELSAATGVPTRCQLRTDEIMVAKRSAQNPHHGLRIRGLWQRPPSRRSLVAPRLPGSTPAFFRGGHGCGNGGTTHSAELRGGTHPIGRTHDVHVVQEPDAHLHGTGPALPEVRGADQGQTKRASKGHPGHLFTTYYLCDRVDNPIVVLPQTTQS